MMYNRHGRRQEYPVRDHKHGDKHNRFTHISYENKLSSLIEILFYSIREILFYSVNCNTVSSVIIIAQLRL